MSIATTVKRKIPRKIDCRKLLLCAIAAALITLLVQQLVTSAQDSRTSVVESANTQTYLHVRTNPSAEEEPIKHQQQPDDLLENLERDPQFISEVDFVDGSLDQLLSEDKSREGFSDIADPHRIENFLGQEEVPEGSDGSLSQVLFDIQENSSKHGLNPPVTAAKSGDGNNIGTNVARSALYALERSGKSHEDDKNVSEESRNLSENYQSLLDMPLKGGVFLSNEVKAFLKKHAERIQDSNQGKKLLSEWLGQSKNNGLPFQKTVDITKMDDSSFAEHILDEFPEVGKPASEDSDAFSKNALSHLGNYDSWEDKMDGLKDDDSSKINLPLPNKQPAPEESHNGIRNDSPAQENPNDSFRENPPLPEKWDDFFKDSLHVTKASNTLTNYNLMLQTMKILPQQGHSLHLPQLSHDSFKNENLPPQVWNALSKGSVSWHHDKDRLIHKNPADLMRNVKKSETDIHRKGIADNVLVKQLSSRLKPPVKYIPKIPNAGINPRQYFPGHSSHRKFQDSGPALNAILEALNKDFHKDSDNSAIINKIPGNPSQLHTRIGLAGHDSLPEINGLSGLSRGRRVYGPFHAAAEAEESSDLAKASFRHVQQESSAAPVESILNRKPQDVAKEDDARSREPYGRIKVLKTAYQRSPCSAMRGKFVGADPLFPPCHPSIPTGVATWGRYPYVGPLNYIRESKNPCFYNEMGKFRCVPYFFLAGFSRCATTDLYTRIMQHPQVAPSNKEMRWFSRRRFAEYYEHQQTFSQYIDAFNGLAFSLETYIKKSGYSKKIIGDYSTQAINEVFEWPQLSGNEACSEPRVINANHIRHLNPDVKIIVIMRHPVERLYSKFFSDYNRPTLREYRQQLAVDKSLRTPEVFHELVVDGLRQYYDCFQQYSLRQCVYNRTLWESVHGLKIQESLYVVLLEDWLRVIPREQFLFLRTEDYQSDVRGHMEIVFSFLGLDPASEDRMQKICNASRMMVNTKPVDPMLPKTRKLLLHFFTPFIHRLADLLEDARFLWNDQ